MILLEKQAVDDLTKACSLMVHGSLIDAREIVDGIELPFDSRFRRLATMMSELLNCLTMELSSKAK